MAPSKALTHLGLFGLKEDSCQFAIVPETASNADGFNDQIEPFEVSEYFEFL
jgi:hypothetical protein